MRFLLTSAGIKNTSIHDALADRLGKPIAEASALCIPTATHRESLDQLVLVRIQAGQHRPDALLTVARLYDASWHGQV